MRLSYRPGLTRPEAEKLLEQWDLTRNWLRFTFRLLGNTIGAAEPEGPGDILNVSLTASGYREHIGEMMQRENPLRKLLRERAA